MYSVIKTFIILTNNYIKDTYIRTSVVLSFGYAGVVEL